MNFKKSKRLFSIVCISLISILFLDIEIVKGEEIKENKESKQVKDNKEITWIKPVDGTISNKFGNNYRFYNMYRAGHTGIDINAKIGTPVRAVADGTVKFVKTKRNMRYGNYIVLEHANGFDTLYAHLQKILVIVNKKVKQGDIIGYTGVSGLASFPHLHFEVTNRVPVRDGAWGYNYICQRRSDKLINKENDKKHLFEKRLFFDFLPLKTIQEKFSFIDSDQKTIEHFYRMKNNICVEKKITPITYYNPERFLPKFEHSAMLEFTKVAKPKAKLTKK